MASSARIQASDPEAIQDELRARIGQLDRDFRLLSIGEICRRADSVRHIARTHGYEPLARLAGGLRDAIARDGRGVAIAVWMEAMRDAIALRTHDEATARAVLAAVSVRLAI